MTIYNNVAVPSSVIGNKMHSVLYHFVKRQWQQELFSIANKYMVTKLTDLFTKVLSKARRDFLLDQF